MLQDWPKPVETIEEQLIIQSIEGIQIICDAEDIEKGLEVFDLGGLDSKNFTPLYIEKSMNPGHGEIERWVTRVPKIEYSDQSEDSMQQSTIKLLKPESSKQFTKLVFGDVSFEVDPEKQYVVLYTNGIYGFGEYKKED